MRNNNQYDLMYAQIRRERRIATAILLFLAILLASVASRNSLLKETIYKTESARGAVQSMADTSAVVKTIGKPFVDYSKAVDKPRLPRFWRRYRK